MSDDRVLIAGAGPVGLVAAAHLANAGVPVTVFEQGARLSEESRASTFHPPTLDMLDELGATGLLIEQGLKAPTFQYRTKKRGLLAEFDFAAIADATAHPYRLQCEQSKLTRILYESFRGNPNFTVEFGCAVKAVSQTASGVQVTLERDGRPEPVARHEGRGGPRRERAAAAGRAHDGREPAGQRGPGVRAPGAGN